MAENLYVHFPFCRSKCSYCALYSRTGASAAERSDYVRRLAGEIGAACRASRAGFKTVYFGGGSPALCDLSPFASFFSPLSTAGGKLSTDFEFTVELHPLDATEEKLLQLKDLGVNRISMGVQSFDDTVLLDMGRGYAIAEAERAFRLVKSHFDNVGIDLIVGYPGKKLESRAGAGEWKSGLGRFAKLGMRHCSVYSLQNERGLKDVPDDDTVLDELRHIAMFLRELGLERYEISNYAVPGFECRHNLAVWCGEDYVGLGEGAYGRVGLTRTVGHKTGVSSSTVTPEEDLKERTLFRLRTREGIDALPFPAWRPILAKHVKGGLLTQSGTVYRLTGRGTEVCDSILADLV